MPPRSFILMRHGQSTYNADGLVNGDPRVAVQLTALGREQCVAVAALLADRPVELAIRSRFPRTAESLALVLAGRHVPVHVYAELDDVHLGAFEGRPVSEYRAWRAANGVDVPPPGEGESRVDALYRYTAGFQRMVDEPAHAILAVVHDVPIRFMLNARLGADPMDGPVAHVANGEPHVLDEGEMVRGIDRMRERLGM